MSIFLPFQDLTHQCIMASSSHKRRIWSQVTYFLYSDFQVGRTERLDNTLNPRFSKAVLVDYFFEELQKLKFFIYDIDSPTGNLKTADFLGELECTLGQVRYMLNLLAYYTDILLAHQGFLLCDKPLGMSVWEAISWVIFHNKNAFKKALGLACLERRLILHKTGFPC